MTPKLLTTLEIYFASYIELSSWWLKYEKWNLLDENIFLVQRRALKANHEYIRLHQKSILGDIVSAQHGVTRFNLSPETTKKPDKILAETGLKTLSIRRGKTGIPARWEMNEVRTIMSQVAAWEQAGGTQAETVVSPIENTELGVLRYQGCTESSELQRPLQRPP